MFIFRRVDRDRSGDAMSLSGSAGVAAGAASRELIDALRFVLLRSGGAVDIVYDDGGS